MPAPCYCEVCGLDINSNTNLERFGKLFCSEDHMNQYVKTRQRRLGLNDELPEEESKAKPKGLRKWFRLGRPRSRPASC